MFLMTGAAYAIMDDNSISTAAIITGLSHFLRGLSVGKDSVFSKSSCTATDS